MIKIKAREKNGVITYKNGRKKEAEIERCSDGTFNALCAFTSTGCLGFKYDNIGKAKEKTEIYLNNIHSFAGGVEVEYA